MMTDTPLVSLIIPIYKVEPYLRECVDSVINQTYKNLEIILVNDGSPDNCPKICDEYAKKDNRIKVIHKSNGGLSDARNAGIEIAKGEYLSFVDSDDVIHSQMIEMLMRPLIEDKGLKMSSCQFLEFEAGEKFETKQEIKPSEIIDYRIFFTKKLWTTAWGKIYQKSLFEKNKYPVGRIHEDEFITYKICYKVKQIAYTDMQLYFYRQRSDSIVSNINLRRITDTYDALKERVEFFKEKGEDDVYIFFLMIFVDTYWRYLLLLNKEDKGIVFWKNSLKKYLFDDKLSNKQRLLLFIKIYYPRILFFYKEIKKD